MSQYCRACGTDLRPVRVSLERPDSVTASAVTAREEIGRAVAEKIREAEGSRNLKRIAEDVLPQLEKFLESPEEKRLRRLRGGVITAASGLGVSLLAILFFLATVDQRAPEAIGISALCCGLGVVTFLIGLGLVVNGMLFTRPRQGLTDNTSAAHSQGMLDTASGAPQLRAPVEKVESFLTPATSDLAKAETRGASVTEHTTQHLKALR